MLRIGATAPDFELRLHTGLRFRLSDALGTQNIVLFFFPKDWSLTDTREAEIFARHSQDLERYHALLIGVNNASGEEQKNFADAHSLPILFGSDTGLEVCRNYRVLWLGSKAIRRVTYVIDRHLVIRGVAHHELLVERHWSLVRRVLESLEEEHSIRIYNRKAHDI